jgi:carboxyl-terminal processing protease
MKHSLRTIGWLFSGLFLGAILVVSLQTLAQNQSGKQEKIDLPLEKIQQLASVFEYVKNAYVEPVDEKKLISDAIAGMVSGLDPHSQYFDEKSYHYFQESSNGRFVGIGIEIASEYGLVKVISPIEDTPAFRAGLKAGDLITRVNTTNIQGLSLNEVAKMIRGEPGTQVQLGIHRREENRNFSVTITREEIKVRSVKAKFIEPGYAWIRLSQFQQSSLNDFVKKIKTLYQEDPHIKGLVLDLRNDPGGLLNQAVGIAAVFLPEGVTIVSTKGQLAESQQIFKAQFSHYSHGKNKAQDPLTSLPKGIKTVPLVVLVNGGSASASEIVAGALQDYGRAIIMGEQTYGKGSVQTIRELGHNSAVKITTARYYTPSGKSIQTIGVIPDIFLDATAEGSPFAVLQQREADLNNHLRLSSGKDDPDFVFDEAAEIAREKALIKLREEALKKAEDRSIAEFGSEGDFPLRQALNQLQGKSVKASILQQARTLEPKASRENQ